MTIKELARKYPKSIIAKAYKFAESAHRGQKRLSGEPYFNHSVETAQSLYNWKLDETTISAGLLHDVAEDTNQTVEKIRSEFGEDIAFLVDGVTKIGRLKYRGEQAKAENMRKLILALSEDLRVIFIKLADRLHNMKTLKAIPAKKQKRIALETYEIYAPIAYRLGMSNVSGELSDLAFPYIYPKEAEWVKKNVSEKYEERTKYLKSIKPIVQKALNENNIYPINIDFRAKRMHSLYKKLLRYDMDIEKIYDLVAIRIIVNSLEECYASLGIIHNIWPPLPGRIKDYIAMPKPNGYKSIHTTVIGPEQKIIEVQIRTQEMHNEAENGLAAHWIYKQSQDKAEIPKKGKLNKEIEWVNRLKLWQKYYDSQNYKKFLESVKIDFFKDRIFAITPKGDVIDLPCGATPIDFAYHIHSDVGNNCVGARVNGSIVPLNYKINSGDVVQILTQKNKKPSAGWINFAKTSTAKEKIKDALKNKKISVKKGKKVVFQIAAKDRIGIIKDISSAITKSHINIDSFRTTSNPGSDYVIDKVQCSISDKSKIGKLILKIRKIKNVKEVKYKIL